MAAKVKHIVAIIGGGVAGSEVAAQLASRGIGCLLFEQSKLPYGKIEEGLPKWHVKLRNQEEQKIDQKIDQPLIQFIPATRFGSDISLQQLQEWGISAVVLAFGAWRDRRLPIKDIDAYIGKGLYYQNQLVAWFNHNHEIHSNISPCEIKDETIVVGGGLASLDVMKIIMLEIVMEVLGKRGIPADIFTLEKEGIPVVLKQHGLTVKKLGLKGGTLYYRQGIKDMPLTPLPVDGDKKSLEKIHNLRQRILANFQQKYCFQVMTGFSPIDKIVEGDRLVGLIFQKTGGNEPPSQKEVHAPVVISSIGSVLEIFPEIPLQDGLIRLENPATGKVQGFDNVFAVGNAVTGRGNIRESLIHSREISQILLRDFFQWQNANFTELVRLQELDSRQTVNQLDQHLKSRQALSPQKVRDIMTQIRRLQKRAGYHGNYKEWIRKNLPVRLENVL